MMDGKINNAGNPIRMKGKTVANSIKGIRWININISRIIPAIIPRGRMANNKGPIFSFEKNETWKQVKETKSQV